MARLNARRRPSVSWSDAQIRKHLSGSLAYAMKAEGARQVDSSKWLRVSDRTIRKALKGIDCWWLRSGRLRPHILRYLTACDKRVRKTLPHVLRAKKPRKVRY